MTVRNTRVRAAIGATLCLLPVPPAMASDVHVAPVTAYIEANIRAWIEDPIIIKALRSQNALHSHMSQTAIDRLDANWRAEFSGDVRPLIDAVIGNPLSKFLKAKQAASGGVVTEILVIDAKGLSVGESEISSDYWQGDELKWQKTYLAGSSALFVDAAQKDESTQMLQSQASLTVSDPKTGKPIGAITIGINLDAL
ncbi:hypothetical protein LJR098_002615 [Rhizobium sp. LjRoot98]|uniref:hypothetical protein n=1 Tax=unclassified Rhizobium TaxID=2613769 RepID=UPI00071268A9|nr:MULTISPECIES: hypothetical protein [unclassified Rhizobium]KQV31288.1 hypothetical protein ASC96_08925 [Rhizobium sp. Root1204]KQY10760.1 hypothetical protein ASD36_08525 [Rhizobium sp. Root1334]KRC04748.1 hypothetical protein ASE23_06295 [Rhizobium sp. Root73]